MGILGPTAGESFAAHMGVPDEYPGGNELCRDLDDAMYEAGLWLLREQQAADPVLRAMMDDRYRLWELVGGVPVSRPERRLQPDDQQPPAPPAGPRHADERVQADGAAHR